MGVSKTIPLPAPTESTILHPSGDDTPTDLATDVSRRTDRTSYSIPEDGSPITVSTSSKGHKTSKSQTSLLIEYFEGGRGPNTSSRPSVRVKVTPSAGKKGKETRDHIQITESTGGRKPSYSRRISLPSRGAEETHTIEGASRSAESVLEGSTDSKRSPIEIEVMHKDQDSDLSERHYVLNPSEISSMPPESVVEDNATSRRSGRTDLAKVGLAAGAAAVGAAAVHDTLKTPTRRRSQSLSREEIITKKVMEKLGQEAAAKQKHKSKSSSRSPSVSQEYLSESTSSPRRRSGKHRKLDEHSEVSGLTDSQVSGATNRSEASKYSVTNPKLLQAVEDTVKRLIFPELDRLKAEQKRKSLESESRSETSRRFSRRSEGSRSREGSLKKGRSRDKYDDSMSEKSYEQGMSQETVVHRRRSKESSKLRDAALGAVAGGLLTHTALKHHDSASSFDRRERRRQQSKSHSHSRSHSAVSAAETEEIFNKHDVAPMPMRSELTGSDITRDSILSERTSTGSFEQQQAEIREIARVSPKQVYATGRKRVKSPSRLRHAQSYEDSIEHEEEEQHSHHSESFDDKSHKEHLAEAAIAGTAAGAGLLGAHYAYGARDGSITGPGRYVHGRSLSPIQSVASYEERGASRHNSQRRHHSTGSLSSLDKVQEHGRDVVMDEHENEQLKKRHRPLGINFETRSEVLVGQDIKSPVQDSRRISHGSWYEGDDQENNRDSGTSYESSKVPIGRLTQYTDDSMDAPYLDRVTAAHEVHDGAEGNAEWVHTPIAVESAVASLLDTSLLDGQSVGSGPSYTRGTRLDSPSNDSLHRHDVNKGYADSPLKQTHGIDYDEDNTLGIARSMPRDRLIERSPRQSPPVSIKDRDSYVPVMGVSAMPDMNDPMPEIVHIDSKSDISTNPPDIQGPKKYDSPTHWPYHGPSPSGSKQEHLQQSNSAHGSLGTGAAAKGMGVVAGAAAAAALAQHSRDGDMHGSLDHKISVEDYGAVSAVAKLPQTRDAGGLSSPFFKDEGYETNGPTRSPAMTPDHRQKSHIPVDIGFGPGLNEDMEEEDDVFFDSNLKRMSGNSHGMAPYYDAATGEGKERIESKDIIALMDHLTVRDAARNARDTEILVTLVQSAAEMRNGFEEMKRFIAEQDNMIIAVGNKQHEKTQRVINGPRPQPSRAPRRMASGEDSITEDMPAKKPNVLRRALKGLSGKNPSDLARIEDMLNHLLAEVADLKAGQQITAPSNVARGLVPSSYEQLRDVPQDLQEGYEPEGHAGTSSPNHSGYFSPEPVTRRKNRMQDQDHRKISQNRISTVMEEIEDDESLTPSEQHVLEYEDTEHMLTPTGNRQRGSSVPLETPPRAQYDELPKSVENTPKTDKSRRQKSSSSSFIPKISRWSKTTASTIPDQSSRQYANASHSGVDLTNYDVTEHYDPAGDDRLRSTESLAKDRPPSPLIPSEVSRVSERPTYQAHRDSLNLQHPQPRQGPTARYQNHLESQVRDDSSPVSPVSDHFGSNPVLARYNNPAQTHRYSGASQLSPISNAEPRSISGPNRPPKIKDEGPLIPPKIPLNSSSPAPGSGKKQTVITRSAAGQDIQPSAPSPKPRVSPVSSKKPTGPRPITSSGSYTPDKVSQLQRNRYRGSPNAIDVDSETEIIEARRRGDAAAVTRDDASETF